MKMQFVHQVQSLGEEQAEYIRESLLQGKAETYI
jgi:hypothetical protein